MLKLRFSKPSYKNYMEGKLVLCKYDCTLIENQTKEVRDKFTVTGIAKCAPSDKVDVAYGTKLADSRAKLAAYKKAESVYPKHKQKMLALLIDQYCDAIEFAQTMKFLKKKEVSHIESILKEV